VGVEQGGGGSPERLSRALSGVIRRGRSVVSSTPGPSGEALATFWANLTPELSGPALVSLGDSPAPDPSGEELASFSESPIPDLSGEELARSPHAGWSSQRSRA
jgi:hypothetical protein